MQRLWLNPIAVGHPRLLSWASSPVYFGTESETIPSIGGPEPNLESLLLLKPDLIMGYVGQIDGLREQLNPIAPLYLLEVTTIQQAIHNLEQVGSLTAREEQANHAIQAFQDRLSTYRSQDRPNITLMVTNGIQDPFYVATQTSLVGSTLSEFFDYPWALADQTPSAINWAIFSSEHILQTNPEMIFILTAEYIDLEKLEQDSIWGNLRAVREKKIHVLTDAEVGGLTSGTRSLGILLENVWERLK